MYVMMYWFHHVTGSPSLIVQDELVVLYQTVVCVVSGPSLVQCVKECFNYNLLDKSTYIYRHTLNCVFVPFLYLCTYIHTYVRILHACVCTQSCVGGFPVAVI